MRLTKAFTMAEAILVMTILGIIATIMITNLKPSEFRDKGLQVLAKKILMQIDTATQQIMVNNTQNGKLTTVYAPGTTTQAAFVSTSDTDLLTLYKKYLVTTRKECSTDANCTCNGKGTKVKVHLKDGGCMVINTGTSSTSTIFPGESTAVSKAGSQGTIFIDVNSTEEPNVLGKDQFIVPLNEDGIFYD
ncbi:MAG: type II secretion system protein [Candidatus Gastranaerophilales bacterium]|nr:type II secretion system protein [Candidatus Gastranaerophilales bacterium]